jgi:hypothetical protein
MSLWARRRMGGSKIMTTVARSWPRRLGRVVATAAGVVLAAALAVVGWDVAMYDVAAWRKDFEHLKREMAQRYANLDWMASHRKVDLRALDAATSAEIDGAHSTVLAALALRRFIRRFGDPHLRVVWRERPDGAGGSGAAAAEPTVVSCESAGYEEGNHGFRFPFDGLKGWRPLRSGNFPTGLAGDVGVLRIEAFGEDRYLGACKAAFRSGMRERELQLAVRAKLQQELKDALADLKAQGAQRLLVDVSGNGGGTEWVTEVVALMTDRALERQSSRLVAPACDRAGIWLGESVCPVLAPAGEPVRLQGGGQWTGPVFILADANTGSASEDFLAWLQQNGVAVVIGARTAGAGCGYVDGGGHIRLEAGPFDVMAPNCARFLNDGTNEIEGIRPDIEIPMTKDARDRQAAALAAVLLKRQ